MLQANYWVFSRMNVRLIKSISLSFIRWWGNVVYSVEKSYVDNFEAWKFLASRKRTYIILTPLNPTFI